MDDFAGASQRSESLGVRDSRPDGNWSATAATHSSRHRDGGPDNLPHDRAGARHLLERRPLNRNALNWVLHTLSESVDLVVLKIQNIAGNGLQVGINGGHRLAAELCLSKFSRLRLHIVMQL